MQLQGLFGAMEPRIGLEEVKNEVLRKIGRNVVLFQQVELILKFLIARGKVSGFISELSAKQEQQDKAVQKQTLGQLIGQYLENTLSGCEESTEKSGDLKEAYVSFGFNLSVDAVYYEKQKEALASIVAGRNELIHHLLPRLDLESIESWLETEQYLDQQREELLPVLNQLQSIVNTFQESGKAVAAYFESDEGKKQFKLSFLRHSRLAILLGEIASQAARHDGWTLINTAGQIIRQYAPEEVAALNSTYGCKTLKGMILATELFNIIEEPTDRGGIRVLYRLKPEWKLQRA
jgi:hypothetical protein